MVEIRCTSRTRFSAEQIVRKLREAEVELAKGRTVSEVFPGVGALASAWTDWAILIAPVQVAQRVAATCQLHRPG
jgi:hypothetical protein